MNLLKIQLRRALLSPFFLGLFSAFLAIDFAMIFSEYPGEPYAQLGAGLSTQAGTLVDADFAKKSAAFLQPYYDDLNNMYLAKTGKSESDPAKALQGLRSTDIVLTEAESERITADDIAVSLGLAIKDPKTVYTSAKLSENTEAYIRENAVSGSAAEFLRRNSALLQARLDEILSDGEADSYCLPAYLCRTQSFLYGRLFKAVVLESVILGVLLILWLVNFEFAHGTQALALTSRRGRKLTADQFRAAMLAAVPLPAVFLAILLPVFFSRCPMELFRDTFFSSPLNADTSFSGFLPITWSRMTAAQYFWACLGIALALQTVLCLLGFAAALFFRSTYGVFLAFAFLALVLKELPGSLPWSSGLPIAAAVNPFSAWDFCGFWLTGSKLLSAYPEYFPALFAVWGSAALLLAIFGVRHFRRADL